MWPVHIVPPFREHQRAFSQESHSEWWCCELYDVTPGSPSDIGGWSCGTERSLPTK